MEDFDFNQLSVKDRLLIVAYHILSDVDPGELSSYSLDWQKPSGSDTLEMHATCDSPRQTDYYAMEKVRMTVSDQDGGIALTVNHKLQISLNDDDWANEILTHFLKGLNIVPEQLCNEAVMRHFKLGEQRYAARQSQKHTYENFPTPADGNRSDRINRAVRSAFGVFVRRRV